MIQCKTVACTKVLLAGVANEAGSDPGSIHWTALHTVSGFVHALQIMILGQRSGRVGVCPLPRRLLFGRQLLQQLVHELLAEAELPGVLLSF